MYTLTNTRLASNPAPGSFHGLQHGLQQRAGPQQRGARSSHQGQWKLATGLFSMILPADDTVLKPAEAGVQRKRALFQ